RLSSHPACFARAFSFPPYLHPRDLHSFPTRRSSDLTSIRSWFDGIAFLQVVWMLLAITLVRRTRLFGVLVTVFAFSFALTVVQRSEEHTSELQSPYDLVCRLLLEKKKKKLMQYLLEC